jgi:hypothetical protein
MKKKKAVAEKKEAIKYFINDESKEDIKRHDSIR